MRTPKSIRSAIAVAVALLLVTVTASPAAAQCSEGQMAEAQLQFQGAQSLLQAQQWDQAIGQLKSIVEFCPDFYWAWRGLGNAYLAKGQFDDAAHAYSQVLTVLGADTEAADYANLAKVYTKQKKYKEARAEYIKAKARAPEDCAVLVNLGILHNVSGYPSMAVEALEDALANCPQLEAQILPRLADAATKAAAEQKKIGNVAKAQSYERIAQEAGGSAGGSTAYQQIQAAMKQGDYARTVTLCDQLLAKEPEHANAWLTKARATDALGRRTDSIEAYGKYLALRPDNMNETAAMIIVMAEDNQCDRAVATSREAMSKFAGMGTKALGKIHFAYGKALFCAKDYGAAKSQFSLASQSGDPKWSSAAREGMNACDEYLNYEAAQRRKSAQQGG